MELCPKLADKKLAETEFRKIDPWHRLALDVDQGRDGIRLKVLSQSEWDYVISL
jgi:hypothetical protein